MSAGPIPWTAVVWWCEWYGLDRDNAVIVVEVILQLDRDRAEAEQARREIEAMRGPPVANKAPARRSR